jgi:hypothetical protein
MLSAAEHIELAVFERHIEIFKTTSKNKNVALDEETSIMNYFENKILLLKERLP